MKAKNIKALVIREYWENRGLLFKTPLVISLVLVLIASIGTFQAVKFAPWSGDRSGYEFNWNDGSGIKINPDEGFPWQEEDKKSSTKKQRDYFNLVFGIVSISMLFGGLLSLFYLSQSLYQDRKDRSILFWRSLPVSETETIASKMITAMIGFPVFFIGFALAATIASLIVLSIGASILGAGSLVTFVFSEVFSWNFMKTVVASVVSGSLFVVSLVPFYSWFLFASAFSKRSPLLTALGIPIAIIISEAVILHSAHFGWTVGSFLANLFNNASALAGLEDVPVQWSAYLVSAIVAFALLFATYWLRNNRYEL